MFNSWIVPHQVGDPEQPNQNHRLFVGHTSVSFNWRLEKKLDPIAKPVNNNGLEWPPPRLRGLQGGPLARSSGGRGWVPSPAGRPDVTWWSVAFPKPGPFKGMVFVKHEEEGEKTYPNILKHWVFMKHVMFHWFQFFRHRWAFTEFRPHDPREEPGLIRGTPKGVFWSKGRAIFQAQHPNEIIFWMILDDIFVNFHFLGTFLAVENWQSIAWQWREITNSTLLVGFLDLKILEDHSKTIKNIYGSHITRIQVKKGYLALAHGCIESGGGPFRIDARLSYSRQSRTTTVDARGDGIFLLFPVGKNHEL